MIGLRRSASGLAVALGALAAAPAGALAADWYVSTPAGGGSNANPCTQAAPCATLQHVASLAGVQDGDAVRIGPGDFPGRVVTAKRLTFEGSGAGTITGHDPARDTFLDASATNFAAVELSRGGAIRRLRARGGFGTPPAGPADAFYLHASASVAERAYEVTGVVGVAGAQGTKSASGLRVSDDGGTGKAVTATVAGDSYFTAPIGTGDTGTAVWVAGKEVAATLTATTIAGPSGGIGLQARFGATATLASGQALDTLGQDAGLSASDAGSELRVRSSTVVARSIGVRVTSGSTEPVRTTIEDSLVVVRRESGGSSLADAVRATAFGAGNKAEAAIARTTLYAIGPGVDSGARALASSGASAVVSLSSTAASAIDTAAAPADADLVGDSAPSSTATVSAQRSAFRDRVEKDGGLVTEPGSGANVAGDPRFADPANLNFVPLLGSPLVDRGEGAGLPADATDLSGGPRSIDGDGDCTAAPDIGAFEAPMASGDCDPRPPRDTTPPTLVVKGGTLKMRDNGLIFLKVHCPGGEPDSCEGKLSLRTAKKVRLKPRSKPKQLRLGARSTLEPLGPGKTKKYGFRLDRAQRALAMRSRKLKVVLVASLEDPAGNAARVERVLKLKAPKPKRRR